MMTSKVEIILQNTPFPGAGQQIGGHHVIESMVDVQGKNWAVYLRGKLSQAQVKSALSSMTNTHFALPVQDEFSLISFKPKGMTHARTNPPGDVTVVRGHMYYARPNPISKTDFHQEMDEMLIDNPEKHFTKYTVKNTDQLHQRLWKGVSYAGESYGWKKGDELWHRRASFIMPKIKINKALKGATMFYHTHPSKDEPSLTSADDIQFYLDLHFAWGIKSFYTVMKHKLDHFTITSKPGGAEKYLRMEEDAFIDTVDGMIGKGEEVAKKEVGEDRPEVEFQNRITKEMVDLFNKKFKSIAKISFRPKAKNPASKLARKSSNNPIAALVNPAPNPPIKVKDQYVAKALDELKGLDYAHEHYGADEYGHTMYVYWWLKHHLAPTPKQPKGRLYKLNEYGLDSDTRKKLRNYLSQPIIGNYNYMDAVYLLALYHDIAKLREKGVKEPGWEIGAEMFRKEIGPELNLPEKLTEDLAFLFDTDLGRKGITDEEFLTQSGDYYGASKLVQMADMITHHPTMYTKKGGEAYKQEAMVNMINQLRVFLDHHHIIQNPPPQVLTLKWVADFGLEDIAYEEAEELLGEFHQSVIPDSDGKTKQRDDRSSGGHLYRLRFNSSVVPGLSRYYAGSLSLSSSKLLIDVGKPVPDDLGKKDADAIYRAVGERLRESYPEVVIDEVEPETIVNPRHANKIQIISISGPSGGGKSTVLHYLHKHIPNSSIPPTYTTRPRRRSDGADRKFVSRTQFNAMLKRGEFVEWDTSGRHFYGRRFKDFLGNVAIIEVSLQGKKHYEKRFANVFSVYLDPDPSVTEEERAKAIFRRGGVTKEGAKQRAKKATETVKRSKKMQFDLRVTMMKGKYNEGAKKVLSEVPLVNDSHEGGFIPLSDLIGITREEQDEADRRLAAEKERIRREEEEEEERRRKEIEEYERRFKQTSLPIDEEDAYRDLHDDTPWANPKDLFDWFEDWAKLINMKNKELKAFLDSDWGKVAGLSPEEAKKLGINSGRTSGRRILKMRKKLGLGGPKDYIKGPRHLEEMWEVALKKWTGPASKKGTDWYWCTRQVRFNKRFMGDNFGERKGPLVKKQKTQNQPSRRLLSLWVWGHDPWRYARKNGIERMPKCPDVPWVGRTEKIKYGKIEVIPGPRKNPPSRSDQFTKQDIIWTGNLEKGLSANLLKAIKKLRHQNREYYGFANNDTLWSHTNFEPTSAGMFEDQEDREKFMKDNGIIYGFHTHPVRYLDSVFGGINKWARWSDVPSPSDYATHLVERAFYGLQAEIVCTQHGFFIIDLVKKKGAPKKLTMKLLENDIQAAKDAWEGKETVETYVLTPGQHARATVKAINSKTKFYNFRVKFYDDPIIGVKWKPHEEKEGWVKFDKRVKVNPHYTPPPNVAMFPGEMPQGPAALYQQTISISQLNPPRPITVMLNRIDVGLPYSEEDEAGEFIALNFHPDYIPALHEAAGVKMAKESEALPGSEIGYFNDGIFINIENVGKIPIDWKLARLVEALNNKHGIRTMGSDQGGFDRYTKFRGGEWNYHPVFYGFISCDKDSMEKLIELFGDIPGFEVGPDEYFPNLGKTMKFSNPPRSKPFPWNKERVKRSPLKTMKRAKATYKAWKEGKPIGFSATTSLKSMGKIPRASGKYKLGDKYVRINSPKKLDLGAIQQTYDSSLADIERYLAERQEILDLLVEETDEAIRNSYMAMVEEYDKLIASATDIMQRMEYLATQIAPSDSSYRVNPVRAPTPYTMMVRHEIGTLEGPHGHVIEGGKLEDLGLQEIITVDTVKEPDTNKFLLGLYEDWKKSAKELGKGNDPIRNGGAFKALKILVNNTRYRPQDEMFDEALGAKEEMVGQTWTLDKIDEYGGICRHQALVNAWILERALKEGHLSGKVFYETGAGHAWTVYRQSDGKEIIIDSAQNTWKYRDDANKVGYEGPDGQYYVYEQAVERPDGKIDVHLVRSNPMAPGYQSYGWTTQDWRSIKVNNKGDIDYSEKCGAEGTRTKSGKPRLCLPAPVIRSLMKSESGKEVLRQQARKKLRAKKGEKVPWHPRIKKLHKKLEEITPEDR